MDPQQLTAEQWAQIDLALTMLWLALGSAVIAGPSLLIAHAVLPSAISTNTISSKFRATRPLFYAIGLAAVVGTIVFFVIFALNLNWLSTYSRYWQ